MTTHAPRRKFDTILSVVAQNTGIDKTLIVERNRTKCVSEARHIACWIAYRKIGYSLTRIAKALSGRNHTTIMSSIARVDHLLRWDEDIITMVNNCLNDLENKPSIMTPTVKVKILDPRAKMPQYATAGSAAFDLAALEGDLIPPGEQRLIKTGLAMAIPAGYAGEIQPRSGLALKYGITITNSPGLIDSDYRGEIGVILYNSGIRDFIVEPDDRIAQMKIIKLPEVVLEQVDELDETERTGGFGSTGVA
jgi:dUTP pyrophosphatase